MNRRLKTVLCFVVDPRSLILVFAVFNFVHVWLLASNSCCCGVVNPWFCSWNYVHEPTILLGASLFLRLNRWWGNTAALLLSSYLIGYFIYLLSRIDALEGLRNDWKVIRREYPYIVGSWDSQYLFALIILCCSIFYLTRSILRRNALRRAADNSQ
jgi:hypothetical protein